MDLETATASIRSEPRLEHGRSASGPLAAPEATSFHPAILGTPQLDPEARACDPIPIHDELGSRTSDELKDSEGIPEYWHSPLSEPGNIRLLRLVPSQDQTAPVQCQLFEYPLQTLPEGTHPYEALSYFWGPKDDPWPIHIQSEDLDYRYFLVTANLHKALLHLRDRHILRTIWIDALCIDQRNDDEKGQQVQIMAKIYAKATHVVVWLGEAAADSSRALQEIHSAASEQHANPTVGHQTTSASSNQRPVTSTSYEAILRAILALLERPWFERIWVLQEVAAARRVLMKCGRMEIEGHVFCAGLGVLKPYTAFPELQSRILSITYLIAGTIFRPRYETSRPGPFSLDIRPLGELVDMYQTYKATDRRDKVYALLGMSSDSLNGVELSANYGISWKEVLRLLVNFCLSEQMSVEVRDDDMEVAVIQGRGYVLGEISTVKRDDLQDDIQNVAIAWRTPPSHFSMPEKQNTGFRIQAVAKSVQVGDVVCLLEGSSKPTIVRLHSDYAAVILVSAPLACTFQSTSLEWAEFVRSTGIPSNDFLLVWDWEMSPSKSYFGEGYEYSMSDGGLPPASPGSELQSSVDKAARLWRSGLLFHAIAREDEATGNFKRAMEVYEAALQCWRNTPSDSLHGRAVDTHAMLSSLVGDHGGFKPLASAAGDGQEAIVHQLVTSGLDPNSKSLEGFTPLTLATNKGNEAMVKLLLDNGADVDLEDYEGPTPLSLAADKGDETLVRLLVDNGASVNAVGDSRGRTPLLCAARNRHEAIVKLLLDSGADGNLRSSHGRMPLSWAVEKGSESVVRLLVERGANVNAKDDSEDMPLPCAVKNGDEAIVKLLLDSGADVNTNTRGHAPLFYAAANGHETIVQLLLDKGANVNEEAALHHTPLFWAVMRRREAVVRLLLENGASADGRTHMYGDTPLLWAARNGESGIVKLLLDNGAHVDATRGGTGSYMTSLALAAENGFESIVRLLLDKNADVNAKEESDRTPLLLAASKGHEAIVRLLIDRGANVYARDDDGNTPLSQANRNEHMAIVALLTSHADRHWATTKTSFLRRPYLQVVSMFQRKGAVQERNAGNRGGPSTAGV